jgi:F-type H+-transporting ATPase subunit b
MDLIFLAELDVIKPDPGLIIWTSFVFLLIYFVLGKFAFKPIQKALKEREVSIQDALDEAKKAREEMSNLKAENEALLKEAREERSKMLKEAREISDNLIKEAKEKAKEEAKVIVTTAKEQIELQKMAAITSVKNEVGLMVLDLTGKLLKKQLKGDKAQEEYVKQLVDEIKMN